MARAVFHKKVAEKRIRGHESMNAGNPVRSPFKGVRAGTLHEALSGSDPCRNAFWNAFSIDLTAVGKYTSDKRPERMAPVRKRKGGSK
jgi:hypothetical protein